MSNDDSLSFMSILSHESAEYSDVEELFQSAKDKLLTMPNRRASPSRTDPAFESAYSQQPKEHRFVTARKTQSDKSELVCNSDNRTGKRRSFTSFFSRKKSQGQGDTAADKLIEKLSDEPTVCEYEDKSVGPNEPQPFITQEEVELQLSQLKNKISERNLQIDRLLRSNKEISSRLMNKEENSRDTIKKINEKDERILELKRSLKEKEDGKKILETENCDLQKRIKSLENELATALKNNESLGTTKTEYESLKKKYENIIEQSERSELEGAFLTEEKEDLEKRLNDMTSDYVYLQDKYEKLSSENVRYKKRFITIKQRAGDAIAQCMTEMNGVLDENRFLIHKNFKNYPKEFQKILKVTDDFLKMRCERNRLAEQIEKLTTKIVSQEVMISDLESELLSAVETLRKNGIEWTVHLEDDDYQNVETFISPREKKGESSREKAFQQGGQQPQKGYKYMPPPPDIGKPQPEKVKPEAEVKEASTKGASLLAAELTKLRPSYMENRRKRLQAAKDK